MLQMIHQLKFPQARPQPQLGQALYKVGTPLPILVFRRKESVMYPSRAEMLL